MNIIETTLTRDQALKLDRELSRVRKKVKYLNKFDCEMVYRLGSKSDTKISKVRVKEDSRPQQRKDRITGDLVDKVNDIITYKNQKGELCVLGKSGGVSLFDGMSPKLRLNKNDQWYLIPKNTPIPHGIIIAKDEQVDRHGMYHYALQPLEDMTLKDFQDKLEELTKYMRPI